MTVSTEPMPQEHGPGSSFQPFFNPATGEWITYTVTAGDSGRQLVRFNWRSAPGGVIPEHVHPRGPGASRRDEIRKASQSAVPVTVTLRLP